MACTRARQLADFPDKRESRPVTKPRGHRDGDDEPGNARCVPDGREPAGRTPCPDEARRPLTDRSDTDRVMRAASESRCTSRRKEVPRSSSRVRLAQAPLSAHAPEDELIARAAGGDASAFALPMRRCNRLLVRSARSIPRSILKDDSDAEEAMQDTYLRAWRARSCARGSSVPARCCARAWRARWTQRSARSSRSTARAATASSPTCSPKAAPKVWPTKAEPLRDSERAGRLPHA